MQANLSLHLSKWHIFGDHMLWIKYSAKTLLAEYNANESKHDSRTTISAGSARLKVTSKCMYSEQSSMEGVINSNLIAI